MRISLNTQSDLRVNRHYGYGKSFVEIQNAFRNFSYNGKKFVVEFNSPKSYVQMYYGPHPVHNSHYKNQYKIHMSQTESDRFEEHKVLQYSSANEFWTANEWGRDAAIRSGIPEEKVFVYHHGINPEAYHPFLRGRNDKIRFLHIDSGSPRKRSDLVEKAFNILYKKNKNIELTLKYSHSPHLDHSWMDRDVLENAGYWIRPGTRHIKENLTERELVSLINFHDVLVYPSEGEGFGMIPLEALATGMPVISTHELSPYAKYFESGHLISQIKPSKVDWGYAKVGNGTIPELDSVIEKMQYFIDNINALSANYFNQVEDIKKEFSWQNKTDKFLTSFIERVGVDTFKTLYNRF